MQLAPQTVDKLQNAAGLGLHNRLHDQLATTVEDRDHDRFLVHVHADILNLTTHVSCLLGGERSLVSTESFPPRYGAFLQLICLYLSVVPMLSTHHRSYILARPQ